MSHDFDGFGRGTFSFLRELAKNNRKEWFDANKSRYEEAVRQPALAFIRAMAPHVRKVSKHLRADDRKVGGSLMRIHRDVRFSKDKSPYKTNVGIQFRHEAGKDVHAPGIYVHVAPDAVFMGMGVYTPGSPELRKIREFIVDKPKRFRGAVEDPKMLAEWRLGGDTLKRAPRGFDPEHPLVDHLKKKGHMLLADLKPKDVAGPEAVETLGARMRLGRRFMKVLCDALEVPA